MAKRLVAISVGEGGGRKRGVRRCDLIAEVLLVS